METNQIEFENVACCSVKNCLGQEFELSELLKKNQTYLISFLRHFGCIVCSEHVKNILTHKKEFQDEGIQLFFIGNGKFEELDEFFASNNTETVVKKYRGSHGGNALFRPIGLELFTRIIARLAKG